MKKRIWALAGLMALTGIALAGERLPPFGARSEGERLQRIDTSPLFEDGKAQNLIPTSLGLNRQFFPVMRRYFRGGQEPEVGLPFAKPDFNDPNTDGLRMTWLGHSSVLLQLDGVNILTDPMLSQRASPFQFMGPSRFQPAPVHVDDLPPIDAVVISHDHYDHLDMQTVASLVERKVRFIVPLGVGAHLEAWGVDPVHISELEWWDETLVGEVRVVCTPARHFSGRGLTDRNRTLWASWAVMGPNHRVWFSGDTGPFPQASEIGSRLGPFDLSMIEIGAYDPAWGSVHLGPDEALTMHEQVEGRLMFPVHWGTFNLAPHRWDQPVVRLLDVGRARQTPLLVPVLGQTMRVAEPYVAPFWRERADVWQRLSRNTLDE
jgi:L-ascorbate metabolism protein UlaG (beta-lactamase superfamily)